MQNADSEGQIQFTHGPQDTGIFFLLKISKL
jgi:hypothetical protein